MSLVHVDARSETTENSIHRERTASIDNMKRVFQCPSGYRKLLGSDLYWATSESAAANTFLRSHPGVFHEYFLKDADSGDGGSAIAKTHLLSLRELFCSSFFADSCEGPPAHAHGGLSAAILDEAMGTTCWVNNFAVMTRSFEIKYNAPVRLNEEVHCEAYIEKIDGYKISTIGRMFYPSDTETSLVETTGTFFKLKEDKMKNIFNAHTRVHAPEGTH